MGCKIFNSDLISDVKDLQDNGITVDTTWLNSLIPAFNPATSGIWQPIWVTDKGEYGLPLMQARVGAASVYAPCNCNDASIISQDINDYNICDYCGDYSVDWSLSDKDGNVSPREYTATCCSGACDIQYHTDDFIPKIPVLNQSYITGIYDFKHKKEFPACSNPGLGKERFIKITDDKRYNIKGADLCIDWVIKDTISEIAYEPMTSQHDSEYLHNASYEKSKIVSKTCGNFILTALNGSDNTEIEHYYQKSFSILSGLLNTNLNGDTPLGIIPTPTQFSVLPYGIDGETYKNIFIHQQKMASYWKWNYSSGILCWYRYHDKDKPVIDDPRPIHGVDLYIPPGDVFFATNDGPEPVTDFVSPTGTLMDNIQSCPSGLKITEAGSTKAIIPSGSQFLYVSANIYSKFYELFYTVNDRIQNPSRSLTISAILCTSPAYDKITVDLLKDSPVWNYDRNDYEQIDILNKDMQKDTDFDSVSNLNYISDQKDLINTLYHKYGGYVWVPPNDSKSITLSRNIINDAFYVDIDFDLVIDKDDYNWSVRPNVCRPMRSCAAPNFPKKYTYNQTIGYSQSAISTEVDYQTRYSRSCISGQFENDNYALYSAIYLNDSPISMSLISTGCYNFVDIYPRISSPNTQTFCDNCDDASSFYLIPDADTKECGGTGIGFEDFCYASLAFRYNNSPPQYSGDPQDRTEREIADGTLRKQRNYRSIFFNPHIDIVAFHPQGGAAVNSKPFNLENFVAFEKSSTASNLNEITVKFDTDDVGIKLYKISAEFLQTGANDRAKCKRFPVQDSCKCLPVLNDSFRSKDCSNPNPTTFSTNNVFTPSLSTVYSPRLKKYGGYNQQYLDQILEQGSVTAGGTLTALRSKIDPENPYGCDVDASITLYNYTNTDWQVSPIGFDANHADIILSVSENANLTGRRWNLVLDRGNDGDILEYSYEPVFSTKRFTTKVTINDTDILYDGQSKVLSSSVSSVLNVKLQNPFLESLLATKGHAGAKFFPTSGKLLDTAIFSSNNIYELDAPGGMRGNEVSAINMTLQQRQRTQLLLFSIDAPGSMGNLQKGFFDPNKGLTSSITDKTPIKSTIDGDGKISRSLYYDHDIHPDIEFDEGSCLHGTLNEKAYQALYSINEFDLHKKVRLYLQIGGKWYQYNGKNIGGFFSNNQTFPGRPFIFEYIDNSRNSKALPGVFPTSVKKNTYFDFVYNQYNYKNLQNGVSPPAEFPLVSNKFSYILDTPKTILIPGTRAYYMVPEIDPAIDTGLPTIDSISSFAPTTPITFGKMIKFADGSHWMCINPDQPSSRSSYIWSDFNYLYHNFSNLHLDFRNLSKNGYLYNSDRPCNHDVNLYHPTLQQWQTNTVLKKSIVTKFVTENGSPVVNLDAENVYMIPYTVLELQRNVRNRGYYIIDLLKSYIVEEGEGDEEGNTRYYGFTVGYKSNPIAEFDRKLLNNMIPSKWGDVINYDLTLLDPYKGSLIDVDYYYPQSTYNNDFYKMIINNHNRKQHFYRIYPYNGGGSSFTINHTGLVYFDILQPYNIGDGQPYSINAQQYHNYLPFIDINLLNDPNPPAVPMLQTALPPHLENNVPYSGQIKMDGLHHYTNPDTANGYLAYDDNKRFWINFTEDDLSLITSAFVPNDIFYSPTLRIDDPPYWFYRSSIDETTLPPSEIFTCRRTFRPIGPTAYTSNTSKFEQSSSFTQISVEKDVPYYRYPIYCDTDDQTCKNDGCYIGNHNGIIQTAWKNVSATYKIGESNSRTLPSVVPYMISYDAGLYNVIGNDQNITIKRFELPYDNNIELNNSACTSENVFPTNYIASTVNPVYQKELEDLEDVAHDPIVTQTDDMANEMLFRILHGEAQIVNKEMLLVEKKPLTKKDLIAYVDPPVTATDIYEEILYNYDTNASMANMKIDGSFYVDGILTIGSTTSINIGAARINLRIREQDGSVYITGTYNGYGESSELGARIYVNSWVDQEYLIQTWDREDTTPDPPAGTQDTSIAFVGECNIMDRRYFSLVSAACNTTSTAYERVSLCSEIDTSNYVSFNIVQQVSYAEQEEHFSQAGVGRQCCGIGLGVCCDYTVRSIGPAGMQRHCGQPTWGRMSFIPPKTTGTYPPCAGDGNRCTDFEVGYCGKSNCEACSHTLESHQLTTFNYDFQQCRTPYNLIGHAYRQQHRNIDYSDHPIVPRPPECYTDSVYECDACTDTCIDFGEQTICEQIPLIFSFAEQEANILANMAVGSTSVMVEDPSNCGTFIECCTYVVGGGSRCPEEDVKNCSRCGCPDLCFTAPCDFPDYCDWCLQGSFFRPADYGQWEDLCEVGAICGVQAYGDRGVKKYRRIYLKTENKTNPQQYNPLCPSRLVDVSYTSKSITVSIGGIEKCFSANLTSNKCPTFLVNSSMQELDVQDNMITSCAECSPRPASLFLPDQKQSFVIKHETRLCVLGVKYSNTVNANGTMCLQETNESYHSKVCMQCGGGGIEYGCQELGSMINDTVELFGSRTWECLKGLPGGLTSTEAAYEIPEWEYELKEINKIAYAYYGDGGAGVPVDDIIEGIIPGSVQEPQIITFSLPGTKIKRDGSSSDAGVVAYVAHVEYQYARPTTIQDILRDDDVMCTEYGSEFNNNIISELTNDNPIVNLGWCTMSTPFPPEYRRSFTDYQGRRFYTLDNGAVHGASFLFTNPIYKQNSDCYDGITCYYEHSITVCGDGDYCCYADLQVVRNDPIIPSSCSSSAGYGDTDTYWAEIDAIVAGTYTPPY